MDCKDANPKSLDPTGEYGIHHGTWKQKAYTRGDTKQIKIQMAGGSALKEKPTLK